jgi:para-nitrobenzyl esterase
VGTYGTQDQTAALEFIRDTAAAFGGDATRVTIFGQSAGAASVAAHMVSPPSQGLFHRVIIESGAFSTWTAQPYNISKTRLAQFAANTGCAGRAGAALLACLRALNATPVLAGDKGLTSAFLEWSPTIDGGVVPDDPRVLLAQGKAADIPVIMGFNADEGSMFVRAPKNLNASDYAGAIGAILGAQQAAVVAAEYPCADYKADLGQSDCWWALAAVERDCSECARWRGAPPPPHPTPRATPCAQPRTRSRTHARAPHPHLFSQCSPAP